MTTAERIFEVVEKGILFLTFVLYPFAVYFGLHHFEPWVIYTGLGGVLSIRFLYGARKVHPERLKQMLAPGVAVLVLFLIGGILNDETFFFLLPGLISAVLGGFFLYSYLFPPSIIEHYALMSVSDFTEETRAYCRRLTLLWVGFMTFNTIVVLYLTFASTKELWTLYTGFLAYVLMGLLFAGEFSYRVWKFRQYRGYWFDPFLRWLFPPRGNVKPTYIPLRKLLVQGRRNDYVVSQNSNQTRTWGTFSKHVSGLSDELRNRSSSNRWAILSQNAYSFCTGLLATWQADCVAVIPPGKQRETLSQILENDVDGVISDEKEMGSNPNLPVLDPLSHANENKAFQILEREQSVLELFTSGSTGARTAIPKTLRNITDELRTLEEQWSHILENCKMVSTVSHQHIYGLLFHVLWPLSAGRTFFEEPVVYPDNIVSAVKQFTDDGVCLVSTPAHLRRLVKYDAVEMIAPHVRRIFSSGGVLPQQTADTLRDVFGHETVEVFGSTETGGIAWRTRTGHTPSWTPFEPVDIRTQDTLHVQSPFIHPELFEEDGWFHTGDRCTKQDTGFKFLGRADREVNIADKRVSLSEVEQTLMNQDEVDESKALSLERESFESARKVIAAVVILSDEGRKRLASNDRKEMTDSLREQLAQTLDPVAVPKLFRFVDEFPRDAQGKVTENELENQFSDMPDHQQR